MNAQDAVALALDIETLFISVLAQPGEPFSEALEDEFEEVDEVQDNLDTISDLCEQFAMGLLNQKDFRLLLQRILMTTPFSDRTASIQRLVRRASAPLTSQQRHAVNQDLVRAGLDGKRPWPRLGQALNEIGEILYQNGIAHDTMSADRFRGGKEGQTGRTVLDIEFINKTDSFSPIPITNSTLVVTYHQFEETGRWEVIAYLS